MHMRNVIKLINIIIFLTMHQLSWGISDEQYIEIMSILNNCLDQKKQSLKVPSYLGQFSAEATRI